MVLAFVRKGGTVPTMTPPDVMGVPDEYVAIVRRVNSEDSVAVYMKRHLNSRGGITRISTCVHPVKKLQQNWTELVGDHLFDIGFRRVSAAELPAVLKVAEQALLSPTACADGFQGADFLPESMR